MSEEVSLSVRIGVTMVLLASFLSSILIMYRNVNSLLVSSQNQPISAVITVSIQNIVNLTKKPRRYVDLYKSYEIYENHINSISGVDKNGVFHLHLLLNADFVDNEASLKKTYNNGGYTGYVNIDNMYSDYLNQYCDTEHARDWLQVYVTKSNGNESYDIYYQVVDLGGR